MEEGCRVGGTSCLVYTGIRFRCLLSGKPAGLCRADIFQGVRQGAIEEKGPKSCTGEYVEKGLSQNLIKEIWAGQDVLLIN